MYFQKAGLLLSGEAFLLRSENFTKTYFLKQGCVGNYAQMYTSQVTFVVQKNLKTFYAETLNIK